MTDTDWEAIILVARTVAILVLGCAIVALVNWLGLSPTALFVVVFTIAIVTTAAIVLPEWRRREAIWDGRIKSAQRWNGSRHNEVIEVVYKVIK